MNKNKEAAPALLVNNASVPWAMGDVRHFLLAIVATIVAISGVGAASAQPASIEKTSSYRLLQLEQTVRPLSAETMMLLHDVIAEATEAARTAAANPKTTADGLAAFVAIQTSLAKHNFLQPVDRKDWPQTMGIALTPAKLDAAQLEEHLAYSPNAERRQYFQMSKPFYFVDCDMGSQLFIAVGERLGWDIRLVEVPDHNFVRWQIAPSVLLNWDWTHGASRPDSDYGVDGRLFESLKQRRVFLQSFTPLQAEAYFLGLIGGEAKDIKDRIRIFEQATAMDPFRATTQNNFAWALVTTPNFAEEWGAFSISNALASLSADPTNGNRADTLACAFAAARPENRDLAVAIERYAVANARSISQRESFSRNSARMARGELCRD